ncbi:MAG: LysR family transcriptional regulator [Rhodobacteraceae bacterium]|nr:LysR family transcriptional regulator [Alphaproteobacteria bacterium]NNF71165.1 LysR family transcriptional regulator [Paracoccaceae bacterium]NNK65124.1 LysR family transcriptional regulator [Paracoccaceae bacterium]
MNVQSPVQVPILELDLLKTLVAIAETGNFSSAAEVVHRTPSAVSMQVKRIEDLLGRPVFLRDSRSVRLTSDGEVLLEHGRRLLALNREVVARFVQPDLVGEVRLGAPDDVAERFLPSMLRRFRETHPGVVVNVVVDVTPNMMRMVREGRLDMTVVTRDGGFTGSENAELLVREPLVWAMLRGGVAAESDPLPVSVWEEGCSWRAAGLSALEAQGRAYRVAFESAHISAQRGAILADLVVAPLPVSALTDEIVEVPAQANLPQLPDYTLGLFTGASTAAPVRAAADHIRASFAKH